MTEKDDKKPKDPGTADDVSPDAPAPAQVWRSEGWVKQEAEKARKAEQLAGSKEKAPDLVGYRESPPYAPPPAPVQPTEYQRQLQTEAEARRFQQELRGNKKMGKNAAMVAAGGMGCGMIILWVFALAGVGVLVLIGLIIFSCSH